MGYHRAGFEVVGVDIEPQPRYPFEFHQTDALTFPIHGFDAIHASPPCQHYSNLARRNANADAHPALILSTRHRLGLSGLPYIIENVVGAPLHDPTTLCGTMFAGLRVIRHRLFETDFPVRPVPPHPLRHPLCYTRDKRKAHYGRLDEMRACVSVNGGGNCSVAAARDAMGIPWMTKAELNEAIPPAYTEYVGRHLRKFLTGSI